MRRRTARLALLAVLAAPLPAAAQDDGIDFDQPLPAPRIPAEFLGVVTAASPARLDVRGLDGQTIPVDIADYAPRDFELLQGGRYLGFRLIGLEAGGYLLVDRAATGEAAVHATGDPPSFSPDGRFFAVASITGAGWNNFEGLAVWEVGPRRTARRFFTLAVIHAENWRINAWVRPNCVAISADGREELELHYSIRIGEEEIRFGASCLEDEEPDAD